MALLPLYDRKDLQYATSLDLIYLALSCVLAKYVLPAMIFGTLLAYALDWSSALDMIDLRVAMMKMIIIMTALTSIACFAAYDKNVQNEKHRRRALLQSQAFTE
jgi:hypothetical protein